MKTIEMKWNKERLKKFPVGSSMLADRGFSSCTPFYLNLNSQLTPYFLDGRDQFYTGDILLDRKKCKARYTSETNFSRASGFAVLQDRSPRCIFLEPTDRRTQQWRKGSDN